MKQPGNQQCVAPNNQTPEMVFNSAVYLYADAVALLEMSQKKYKNVTRATLYRRRTYARSSILLFHSCIEALLNFLLFCVAFKKMSESLKKQLEKLPFDVKLKEVTKDCCGVNKIEDSIVFKQVKELQELRNSFMHPKVLRCPGKMQQNNPSKFLIKFGRVNKDTIYTHSKLHKHFNYIDNGDAKKAKRITDSFFSWLKVNLNSEELLPLTSMAQFENLPKIDKLAGTKIEFKMDGDSMILFDNRALKLFSDHFKKKR